MRLQVVLYDALPEQMALFKAAHPFCEHIPLFHCGDEVWPQPALGWKVETNSNGNLVAVLEVPDAVDGKELQVAPQ